MAVARLFNLGDSPVLPTETLHIGRVAKSKDRKLHAPGCWIGLA